MQSANTKTLVPLIWEGQKKGVLTSEFKHLVGKLLVEEINIMRKIDKENKDCWYCGSATIGDLSDSKFLTFTFGSKEDEECILKGDVNVVVELDGSFNYI